MRQPIHFHYAQLIAVEREFVDECFRQVYTQASDDCVPLAGDDRVERAVDALARAVIESRPAPAQPKPRFRVKALRDPEDERRDEERAFWKHVGNIMS